MGWPRKAPQATLRQCKKPDGFDTARPLTFQDPLYRGRILRSMSRKKQDDTMLPLPATPAMR
jgi:hypothetical protein